MIFSSDPSQYSKLGKEYFQIKIYLCSETEYEKVEVGTSFFICTNYVILCMLLQEFYMNLKICRDNYLCKSFQEAIQ